MENGDRELLIRIDERTKNTSEDVKETYEQIESIHKTLTECIKPRLEQHDKEIALLKHNWKLLAAGLGALVTLFSIGINVFFG